MAGWYISGRIHRFKERWEGTEGMVSFRNAPVGLIRGDGRIDLVGMVYSRIDT